MKMKKLGLVGGMSWVSTLDYYRNLNEGIHARRGGLEFAECLVYSLNFGDIQAVEWPNSFPLLLGACESLVRGGADAIVLCANTAHFAADELAARIPLPFVHIGVATAAAVRAQGLRKIGLLGTKFTMEMSFYRDKLATAGIETLVPPDQTTRDYVQRTIKDELGTGLVLPETKAAYVRIAHELIAAGAEGIVLGCTEVPLLLGPADLPVPVFDTAKIHCQAAIDFALGQGLVRK
jgi:aspartate racemase